MYQVIALFFCMVAGLPLWAESNQGLDREQAKAAAFLKAENSMIDILRAKDPQLDSRWVSFSHSDLGGFAVCCFTDREYLVTNSKTKERLGKFNVSVGNRNYIDYEKGIVFTSISDAKAPQLIQVYNCGDQAESIAKALFPRATAVIVKSPTGKIYYSDSYIYDVIAENAVPTLLGTLSLSPVACAFIGVQFAN